MTMEIRDYRRICPKCGCNEEHQFRYVPAFVIHQGDDGRPHIGPCMVRTCPVCRYSYNEATQDGEVSGRRD